MSHLTVISICEDMTSETLMATCTYMLQLMMEILERQKMHVVPNLLMSASSTVVVKWIER